jgi:hypothetical protein
MEDRNQHLPSSYFIGGKGQGKGKCPEMCVAEAFALVVKPAYPPTSIRAIRDERRITFIGKSLLVFLFEVLVL